jgi:hypothetical protein
MRQLSAAEVEPTSDVRILIDVSGSMKKNDPNNLRAPALRLVLGLLPDKSQSGVWTFGKYVNMLVPLREVNDAWKLEAERQSNQIHSYGLFTNIEQALNKATANEKQSNPRFRRSVILLSDGLVDVSSNIKTNQQSRQRILDDIVPRLKKANVAVHTIALSNTADHELLRAISLATDGWYEQVDNADQLQRVFLHLFEKAAKRDTVPLLENHFKIDSSVSEMTLLVFRREGSKQTQLILPNQSRLSQQDKANNVRWHNENNYDLITIDKPAPGEWQIDADIDPDNRVMVVTDLKLKSTDLPNNILIGESFDFEASLTEKNQLITRQDFLKLVNAQLLEESEITDPIKTDLNNSQQEGVYRINVGETFQPGRNDVVISFKSATFERERRQSINVVEMPFAINIEQLPNAATRTHRLTLTPDLDFIKAEPLNIAALLTASDGSEWSYEVLKNAQNQWQITLADLKDNEDYTLALQIRGETVKGRSLFLQPKLITLHDSRKVDFPDEKINSVVEEDMLDGNSDKATATPAEAEADTNAEIEQDKVDEPVIDEMAGDVEELLPEPDLDIALADKQDETVADDDALSPASKLAVGNAIILLFVVIGIFLWRRHQAANKNPGDLL